MNGVTFHHTRSILDITNNKNTANVVHCTSKGFGGRDGILINVGWKLDRPLGLQGFGIYLLNKGFETAFGWEDNILNNTPVEISDSRSNNVKGIFIERIITDVSDDIKRVRSEALSGSTRAVPIRIVQRSRGGVQDGHKSIFVRTCHWTISFPLSRRRADNNQSGTGLVDHSTD